MAPEHAAPDERPQDRGLDAWWSPAAVVRWFSQLADAYTCKLLWMLFTSQWVIKGFVYGLCVGGIFWLLKDYGIPGPQMQVYQGVTMVPWAAKPVFGLLSDLLPICGYTKAPYMLLSTVLAVSAYAAIGFSPHHYLPVKVVVLGLCMGTTQVSVCDLLTEAVYAARMRERPDRGADLITFVWTGISIGSLVATLLLGPVLEHLGPAAIYAICLFPACLMVIPTALNFHGEARRSPEEAEAHRARVREQPELIALVAVMAVATLSMIAVALLQDSTFVSLGVAVVLLVLVTASFLALTKPIIGRMNTYFVLQNACAVSIEGGAFYFYTNDAKAYPEGPHFSMFFYTTVVGLVASVFGILGMALYQCWLKDCKYHPLFIGGNIVACAIHCAGILVFTRHNLVIGIPDHAFVVGNLMLTALVNQALFIPGIVMLSHLCPKGLEATMYALLAGCANFGSRIAEFLGAALLELLSVTPRGRPGESEAFKNLWIAALVSSLAPLVTIVLVPFMIPNARQDQKLLEDNSSAVDGSPWQRYWKGSEDRVESKALYAKAAGQAA